MTGKGKKEKIETTKEKTKKSDFVEIEFVGKANGEIFDTNIKQEAEKVNLKIEVKPLIVCIGQEMLVKGFDKELEDREIRKEYKITLQPEEAFGKRNKELVKIIPLRVFKEKNIQPYPGAILNLDGFLAKILTVSGGRVIVDFNNPLAGKEIEYEFTIKRRVTDENEKINALEDFFFKKRFSFTLEDKKIIFEKDAEPFLNLFKEKFKEILGKEIEVGKTEKEQEKSKEETKKEEKIEEKKEETKKEEEKSRKEKGTISKNQDISKNHNTQKYSK